MGKNSKKSKVDRTLRELQMHTRLSADVSAGSLALGYGQVLRDHINSPLLKQGADEVDQAVSIMKEYSLLREDLDSLIEVTQWPDKPSAFRAVDSKRKAAFTRKYNKMDMALPYSVAITFSRKKGGIEGRAGAMSTCDSDSDENDDDT